MKAVLEQLGAVCMLPAREQWRNLPRRVTKPRKLVKWLHVRDANERCVVRYDLVSKILASLRGKPVEWSVDKGRLQLRYPRGLIKLELHNPSDGYRRVAGGFESGLP
jgi:hypothetical protein